MDEARAAAYREQGYVLVPAVFSAEDVERMNHALIGISDAGAAWLGPWSATAAPAYLVSRHHIELHPPWDEAVTRPALCGAVLRAMAPSQPIFDSATLIAKPSASGASFPPHQDAQYYGADDPAYVIATVFLDDMTLENGPVRVWPGSHRAGLLRHTFEGSNGKAYLPLDVFPMERSAAVIGKAGDVVLMSHFTVHGSQPNQSSAIRRTVRLGYRSRPKAT